MDMTEILDIILRELSTIRGQLTHLDDEYYVYPVLPGTDYREHTLDRPFCGDGECPCHEDEENLKHLSEWYQDGLIGSVDGDKIYHGRTI